MTAPWSQLGIEPTSNVRDIKKAYAQKLKVTRPDEHPEAFRVLHQAYKRAINMAESGLVREKGEQLQANTADIRDFLAPHSWENTPGDGDATEDDWLASLEEAPEASSAESSSPTPEPMDPEQPLLQPEAPALDEEAAARLMEKVDTLLCLNPDIHKPEKWRFIEQEPQMMNEHFREEFGARLLARIIKHQAKQMKLRGDQWHLKLGEPVLSYLNLQFGWAFRFHDLLNRFDYDDIAFLEDLPTRPHHTDKNRYGIKGGAKLHKRKSHGSEPSRPGSTYPFMRLAAMTIDLAIVAVPLIVMARLFGVVVNAENIDIAFVVYLLIAAIFEASKWRATIGKRIMGLQVLNLNLSPLNIWEAIWRALMLAFSITLLQWMNYHWGEPVSDFAAVIWPFIICSWIAGGRYPHDLLSFTIVLNQGRTR